MYTLSFVPVFLILCVYQCNGEKTSLKEYLQGVQAYSPQDPLRPLTYGEIIAQFANTERTGRHGNSDVPNFSPSSESWGIASSANLSHVDREKLWASLTHFQGVLGSLPSSGSDVVKLATELTSSQQGPGQGSDFETCATNFNTLMAAIKANVFWAVKMIDAWGKPGPGLTQGSIDFLGQFDECLETQVTGVNFESQHCVQYLGFTKIGSLTFAKPLPMVVGTCVPSICSAQNLSSLINIYLYTQPNITGGSGGGHCYNPDLPLSNKAAAVVAWPGPAVFLIKYYWGWWGLLLPSVLTVASAVTAGTLISHYNLAADVQLLKPQEHGDGNDIYYVKPYCRIGPYLVGMITGYILYRTDCKVYLNRLVNCLGWAVAAAVALAVVYGLFESTDGHPISKEVAALYNALARIAWGTSICWVIFACATGYGGFVNTLLSWKGLVPLSRLTYCAYLVHILVLFYFFFSQRSFFYIGNTNVVFLFMATLGLVMLVAFVTSMAFEAPFMGLKKILLGGLRSGFKRISDQLSQARNSH
ncbi:hypothetical protein RRG08_059825 [Elysia crispata]|uniref:Nose resistant-to-fluoxetine protein N-terminal domain-containing protein n=1 Tax=Elysia crispata TaxID=231223 RepID=A0AAE0ZDL0_9GAST|nr:hypothetical protein RRG08_059825 [Elysia crispata]